MMANHKLKGVLGARDKSSSHGSSCSLAMEKKFITNLEILVHHLQDHLRNYEDPMTMKTLMEDVGEKISRRNNKM